MDLLNILFYSSWFTKEVHFLLAKITYEVLAFPIRNRYILFNQNVINLPCNRFVFTQLVIKKYKKSDCSKKNRNLSIFQPCCESKRSDLLRFRYVTWWKNESLIHDTQVHLSCVIPANTSFFYVQQAVFTKNVTLPCCLFVVLRNHFKCRYLLPMLQVTNLTSLLKLCIEGNAPWPANHSKKDSNYHLECICHFIISFG